MAEQFKSITDARKALPELSRAAERGLERCIITNQGEPQSVLMGYREYLGLVAAAELLDRPRDLSSLERGLQFATQQDALLTFDQLKENLRTRRQHAQASIAPDWAAEIEPQPLVGDAIGEIKAALSQIMSRLGIKPSQPTEQDTASGNRSIPLERPAHSSTPNRNRFTPLRNRPAVSPPPGSEVVRRGLMIPDFALAKGSSTDTPLETPTSDQVMDILLPSTPTELAPGRKSGKQRA